MAEIRMAEIDDIQTAIELGHYDELSDAYGQVIDMVTAPDLDNVSMASIGRRLDRLDNQTSYMRYWLNNRGLFDLYKDVRAQVDTIISGQQG